MYGVNNTKFYAVDNNQDSLQALKRAAQYDLPEDREKIFRDKRPALMKLIRLIFFIIKLFLFLNASQG